ncbi:GNAT family N-acetyltransferase [Candidatus Bipolaricaulota bacterium]|nr:GNAT family N-acetyltransferase [Candidatus Bipolaricaulota bacterium]
MIHELRLEDYRGLRPLADGLKDQGMAQAVLAGTRPGIVIANCAMTPTSLFIVAPEGAFAWTYLAGDPSDGAFHAGIRDWFFNQFCPAKAIAFTFLAADSNDWDSSIVSILAPREPIRDRRLHYTNPSQSRAWRDSLPEGYEIRQLDRETLSSPIHVHETVLEWLDHNFGSQAAFLEHGLGAVAIYENEVVAWCLADSVVGDRADIGVETEEAHQRKGLAYATTCLVLEKARDHGINHVGWHCHAINTPSVKTATKVGFRFQSEYVLYPMYIDVGKHSQLVKIVAEEKN